MGKVRHAWRAWPARHAAAVLLTVTVAGLIAGGLLHLAGRADAAGAVWFAVGGCGALYALWSMADSLRRHRIGLTSSRCWPSPGRWPWANCSPLP